MKTTYAALLGAVALAAHGQVPNAQWKPSSASLYDLISVGYTIIDVRNEANSKGRTITYVLQKDKSVGNCTELHAQETLGVMTPAQFSCVELVRPYLK
ncbi:hypothetical protein SB778_03715 [Paraburkholderia sp. SIMBA_050]